MKLQTLLQVLLALNFIAICCASICASTANEDSKSILVVLPNVEKHENVNLLWAETGSEMVQLHIISGRESYAATVDFISRVFHMHGSNCSEFRVIGVVGDLDSQTASIIHTLASRANLSITLVATSAPSTLLPVTNLDLPNLLDMNPLQHYVDALVSFMEELNWNRIGLITDNSLYHLFAAELLQKKLLNSEVTVIPYVRIGKTNMKINLQQFEEYGTQIIVLLVSNEVQCSVLSQAVKVGYIWPQYALIALDLELHLHYSRECQVIKGVIVLKNSKLLDHCKREEFEDTITDAAYPYSISHEFILAIINLARNFTFEGATGTLTFRNNSLLTNISIIQVQNGKNTVIASYNSELQELEFDPDRLAGEEIPQGTFRIVVYRSSVLHFTLVLTLFLLCFGFITVNLVLYIVFRNEPEVKATSVSVSMCMFLGCYLLILFLPMLLLEIQPIWYTRASATFICTTLVWLSTAGLSFSLIFATLIVKILRVYLIFCNPHSYKKKFFSNPALLWYIIILISPIIFLLFLMTAIDEFTKVRVTTPMKSHAEAYDSCSNKWIIAWITAMLTYNAVLILALATLALKSSKIRFKHFGDTKATNAFAYLSIFVSSMTIVYWYFFYSMPVTIDSINKTATCLYIGHTTEALLCQIFLFVPKVYPPTMRWFRKNEVKSK